MENTNYLLVMDNISKEFPGVKALDGVNLKVLWERTEPGNQHL